MKGTVILSHGLESGPQATKVSALAEVCAELGWDSVRPDYRSIVIGKMLATATPSRVRAGSNR